MNEFVLEDLVVVKRSGQRVNFNGSKIALAIKNAFDQVRPLNNEKDIYKVYNQVLEYINNNYQDRKTINVEDIQDIIEKSLHEHKYEDVYLAFSEYRCRRAILRKAFSAKNEHKFTKAIERIVNESKENKYLNNYSKDILLNFGKTISCEYAKTYILDNKLVRLHEEGSIYIHNLDYFWLGKIGNTVITVDDELLNNFPTRLINNLLNLKEEIDGEIAINHFDGLLKKVLIKEFKTNLLENVTYTFKLLGLYEYINIKKINEIIDKINTVFINDEIFVNYLNNEYSKNIINNVIDVTLKKTINNINEGIKELLLSINDNHLENKLYSITINTTDDYECNLMTENYLKVLKSLPKLENVTSVYKIKESSLIDIVSELIVEHKNIALTFTNNFELTHFGNGQKIYECFNDECTTTGRMIVASISINMSRLALANTKDKENKFWESFDELLNITKNGLISIFEIVGDKTSSNYERIFKNNLLDDSKLEHDQKIRKVIKKGCLNLELASIVECVKILESDEEKQKALIEQITNYAKEKCLNYSKETKLNFILSETTKNRPRQKLIEIDKSIYGVKKGITDKPSYERIDSLFKFKKDIDKDLKYISEYQKNLYGGANVIINLNKNSLVKNVSDIINKCKNLNIGFIKIVVRDE